LNSYVHAENTSIFALAAQCVISMWMRHKKITNIGTRKINGNNERIAMLQLFAVTHKLSVLLLYLSVLREKLSFLFFFNHAALRSHSLQIFI